MPTLSIIIPVYNGASDLKRGLTALRESSFGDWELIVVDDGSTDGSDVLAGRSEARVIATSGRVGPAAARNIGAQLASGEYLLFLDADCVVQPDTLALIVESFRADPGLEALFGSYDDSPGAPNFVAQYKNLFHHYVHQHGCEDASTFWTGCGAMKRTRFLALGGFDVRRYRRPSIEDIDLGYRLKRAGGRIRLAKNIQVKHLKAWSLLAVLKSDIFDRGIPWTRLILRDRVFTSDLNLQTHNRVSVVATYGLLLSLAISLFQPQGLIVTLGLVLLLLVLNLDLYRFFYRQRGLVFSLRVIPLHWLYYFYNAISFGLGLLLHWQDQLRARVISSPGSFADGVDTDGH